jgi:hypothetical protein
MADGTVAHLKSVYVGAYPYGDTTGVVRLPELRGAVNDDGHKDAIEGMGEVIFRLDKVAGAKGPILQAQMDEIAN